MSGNPRSLLDGARYLSRADCEALAKSILSYSTADSTRLVIRSGNRGNTRFAVNQVSTAGDNYDANVSIICSFGKRTGTVTTNRLAESSLREAVRSAETLAKLSPEDPEALPELEPQQYAESLGWSEATASLDPARRSGATREISDAARAAGLVATGYAETIAGATAIANSRGLFAYGRQTQLAFTTTVRTPDGTGSGWAGTAGHDWAQVNAKALGARAIEKAKRSVSPVAIEPGRYTVILEPTAVGNLLQLMAFSMSARSADEGRSFFSKQGGGTKIGMKVVDERVTLVSDPADSDAFALPFAPDGTPLSRIAWVENGVVKNLSYDRYWAQKQGKTPTPVPATLRMPGDDSASIEDLIASTERGVLVTRFWYIRPVDPRTILFTGLTRDGTFLIENGKISKAVKNLRFNESPVFMLNNLEKMGKPERVSASESGGAGLAIVVPPIKIRDFNFTSLSDAI